MDRKTGYHLDIDKHLTKRESMRDSGSISSSSSSDLSDASIGRKSTASKIVAALLVGLAVVGVVVGVTYYLINADKKASEARAEADQQERAHDLNMVHTEAALEDEMNTASTEKLQERLKLLEMAKKRLLMLKDAQKMFKSLKTQNKNQESLAELEQQFLRPTQEETNLISSLIGNTGQLNVDIEQLQHLATPVREDELEEGEDLEFGGVGLFGNKRHHEQTETTTGDQMSGDTTVIQTIGDANGDHLTRENVGGHTDEPELEQVTRMKEMEMTHNMGETSDDEQSTEVDLEAYPEADYMMEVEDNIASDSIRTLNYLANPLTLHAMLQPGAQPQRDIYDMSSYRAPSGQSGPRRRVLRPGLEGRHRGIGSSEGRYPLPRVDQLKGRILGLVGRNDPRRPGLNSLMQAELMPPLADLKLPLGPSEIVDRSEDGDELMVDRIGRIEDLDLQMEQQREPVNSVDRLLAMEKNIITSDGSIRPAIPPSANSNLEANKLTTIDRRPGRPPFHHQGPPTTDLEAIKAEAKSDDVILQEESLNEKEVVPVQEDSGALGGREGGFRRLRGGQHKGLLRGRPHGRRAWLMRGGGPSALRRIQERPDMAQTLNGMKGAVKEATMSDLSHEDLLDNFDTFIKLAATELGSVRDLAQNLTASGKDMNLWDIVTAVNHTVRDSPDSNVAKLISKFEEKYLSSERLREESVEPAAVMYERSLSSLLFLSMGIFLLNSVNGLVETGFIPNESEGRKFSSSVGSASPLASLGTLQPHILKLFNSSGLDILTEGGFSAQSGDIEPTNTINNYIRLLMNLMNSYTGQEEDLDCVYAAFCLKLNEQAKLEGLGGGIAKLNSVGLRLALKELSESEAPLAIVQSLLSWQDLHCKKMFPTCLSAKE